MTSAVEGEVVCVEPQGAVLVIRLTRPERRNALNLAALRGLAAAFTRLSEDPDLRVGVICADGPVFCAGLDLADVMPVAIAEGSGSYLQPGQCDPFRLYAHGCRKPVVLAVQGRCFTAGLELLLAADVCIASNDAVFAQQETTRGIMPMGGATMRLPARIGWGNAMRCMLAGATFDAAQAQAWGLVSEVTTADQLLPRTLAVANEIAAAAPLAVQATLENARLAWETGQAPAIEHLRVVAMEVAKTADAREGLHSMLEKRPPVYQSH